MILVMRSYFTHGLVGGDLGMNMGIPSEVVRGDCVLMGARRVCWAQLTLVSSESCSWGIFAV